MARIAGVNLPKGKRIEYALTYLYGIGLSLSQKILTDTKIDFNTRTEDLTEEQVARLRDFIEKSFKVEGDLRREVMMNIKRLKEIGSYRGARHAKHLPARGQRSKTNSRTVRGNVRRTMGSGRKPSAQKT
jgi:small subunit ribosomal protein S13